jgi:hypothetical protein
MLMDPVQQKFAELMRGAILLSANCVTALHEASLLHPRRAKAIAAAMKQLATSLEDPDAPQPGDLAVELHRLALALEEGRPKDD